MSQRHTARAAVTKIAHIQPVRNSAVESQIDRVNRDRQFVAEQINNGEEFLLPLLKRLNAELETLEEKQNLLLQAAEIASHAAPPPGGVMRFNIRREVHLSGRSYRQTYRW